MKNSLPLVSLQLLSPLLSALEKQNINAEKVLESVGLTMQAVKQDGASVHVMVVHQFVENCATATGDPTFCAKVGATMDPTGWPMIQNAMANASTLGDFLNFYVVGAKEVASSATPFLEVRGDMASFGETRRFDPSIRPVQNDGFMIALKLAILEHVLGDRLDPTQVILVLCSPAALPARYERYQKLAGDNMGTRIRFPAAWLSNPLGAAPHKGSPSLEPKDATRDGFLNGFQKLLRQNIGQGGLKAQEAANLVQITPKALARLLSKLGTSISTELAGAKIDYAKEALSTTNRSIADIAKALGYSNPSNFARTFSKEEGMSPRAFRIASKSGMAIARKSEE